MDLEKTRVWTPDKKHWFDQVELGEVRMGWFGLEITTSFQVDGTDYFKLNAGGAYFKDDKTFIIYDYRGVVICHLDSKTVLHFFRPDNEEVSRNSVSLDIQDPQNPIMTVHEENQELKSYPVFNSLHMFLPGRGFF